MSLELFLSGADCARVAMTVRRLEAHDVSRWALTGGMAIEFHILNRGGTPTMRPLHDIDFIAPSFDCIPQTLGPALLLRHVHPSDPPAKTMLQAVDPETQVRVDVFRAYGLEMKRIVPIEIATLPFGMVSLQDMVARHARLNWDLMEGKPVAPKFARDFLRMLEFVTTEEIEPSWREHRKPQSPASFEETTWQLRHGIASRQDLLIPPTYSTNADEICQRCRATDAFPLTDARQVLSILGYC
jgi:hypothetical protein